ncbi:MAG TPA: pirin family protein [Alphaproteobacteria bacterium]|nr:pirin family protein [Alphaproteobacteria bacterium]
MIEVVPFATLGRFDNEWLNARYHFSFAGYRDPRRTGLGPLLVWNDDTVAPGEGFPPHPHRDMEIITYVRHGAVTHEDHLGNRGLTGAGDVQVMTAGRGIVHAEWNRGTAPMTMFQIWIRPNRAGLEPRWAQRSFPRAAAEGLTVLASGRAEDAGTDALPINQDAALLAATLLAGGTATHRFAPGRRAYLVVARGRLTVNGQELGPRDGARIEGEAAVTIAALEESEVVLVDVR